MSHAQNPKLPESIEDLVGIPPILSAISDNWMAHQHLGDHLLLKVSYGSESMLALHRTLSCDGQPQEMRVDEYLYSRFARDGSRLGFAHAVFYDNRVAHKGQPILIQSSSFLRRGDTVEVEYIGSARINSRHVWITREYNPMKSG
ncbi:MAG: hypothetical protein HGA85_02510 [Nanoarchaeota archaeon]|nr:hypothetical protein [Nanoarchaeota archaeon]